MVRLLLSGERTVYRGDAASGARRLLARRVDEALSNAGPGGPTHNGEGSADRVVSLRVPVGPVGPFRWLREARVFPKLYWSGREDAEEVAAVGVADLRGGASGGWPRGGIAPPLVSDDPDAPSPRYYGGMRFDPSREPDEEWAAFGACRFVLPRFELRMRDAGGADEEAVLVCNLVLPRDASDGRRGEILAGIRGLPLPGRPPEEAEAGLPAPVSREDAPDEAGWARNVEAALAAFADGRLGKVVLARRAGLRFAEVADPILLAENLKAATPGCFHFYVEPEEGAAFLGASPERLLRTDGRRVESEAVAGTRPRGLSEADDEDLRDELLGSEKDRSEHAFVRVGIGEALGDLCDELTVEEGVSEMRLAKGRHLVSRVRGTLRGGVTGAEVLGALHPTPAVGGHPKGEALAEIRALEPFDRGWYAGPVGWIGADASELAVGIRSGLARGRELALYSGAGIVRGSEPAEEWAEIEGKIGDFLGAFGLEPRRVPR